MNHQIRAALIVSALAATVPAFGQANSSGTQTSYGTNDVKTEHTLRQEVWSFAPEIGVLGFTDAAGNYDSRAAYGVAVNFNLLGGGQSPWYAGISTGGLYSHAGTGDSNFFGSNSTGAATGGANVIVIPGDVKVGYTVSDGLRVSAHGGGNVIYRSVAGALILSDDSNTDSSLWKVYPNAGLDAEWQIGPNLSLVARPDWTFAPGNDMFVGTIGANFIGF